MELYLGLGSNLGDREVQLAEAVKRLSCLFGKEPARMSSLMETEPCGFVSENRFINAVVVFDLDFPCNEEYALLILDRVKSVEKEMGRKLPEFKDACGRRKYEDRPVDIDILLFGQLKMKTPRLTVPHPLMSSRVFVMQPLSEVISPQARLSIPFEKWCRECLGESE